MSHLLDNRTPYDKEARRAPSPTDGTVVPDTIVGQQNDPEDAVKDFFDRYADHYARSWDLKEHGLHVGIFERYEDVLPGDALENAFQRSRDHVTALLQRVSPVNSDSRVLDVCCGTGAMLSQVVSRYNCFGVGVDISRAQIEHAVRLRGQRPSEGLGRVLFREGSASRIDQVIGDLTPFTHACSQDGLLFVQDRPRALQGIHAALQPDGVLVISDFIPRMSREKIDAAVRARVYDDVKWKEGLGFQEYVDIIENSGFELVQAELRPLDMRTTYAALSQRTRLLVQDGDETYSFLARRYEGIVKAVDNRALTWGWFVARKR